MQIAETAMPVFPNGRSQLDRSNVVTLVVLSIAVALAGEKFGEDMSSRCWLGTLVSRAIHPAHRARDVGVRDVAGACISTRHDDSTIFRQIYAPAGQLTTIIQTLGITDFSYAWLANGTTH
jgi:hypothetical protein